MEITMYENDEHECANCGDPCDCGYEPDFCEFCEVCDFGDDDDDDSDVPDLDGSGFDGNYY
jgi:hypothetical protein